MQIPEQEVVGWQSTIASYTPFSFDDWETHCFLSNELWRRRACQKPLVKPANARTFLRKAATTRMMVTRPREGG